MVAESQFRIQKLDRDLGEKMISCMLGAPIRSMQPIKGGKNNQVYKVLCEDGATYIAKVYFVREGDKRDRLTAEFSSLRFLWQNGITCVPRPVAFSKEYRCALYQYVEGSLGTSQEIDDDDIRSAVSLLAQLKELSKQAANYGFPTASEAFFSLEEVALHLRERENRLRMAPVMSDQHSAMRKFIREHYAPLRREITSWCHKSAQRASVPFDKMIPIEERTLSPSDFGFHNAIRKKDGSLVFLDFEYFGWDDPAKTISDFLLHPAFFLAHDLKQYFFKRMLEVFSDNECLPQRVKLAYPLFGLKWCLIFLNEFLPQECERRLFAGASGRLQQEVLDQQLQKARKMLEKISEEYNDFPYAL